MSRSNSTSKWFNEPTRVGVLTIKDRRARVQQEEDFEDIKQATEDSDESSGVRVLKA